MKPFSEHALSDVLRAHLDATLKEIKALDSDYVLKAAPTELEQHFISKGNLEPLILRIEDQHIVERSGVDIDVSHDFARGVLPGERAVVRGTRLRIAVPFEGDREFWRFRPSSVSLSGYPDITISEGQITLSFSFPDDSADAQALKARIDSDIKRLAAAVGWVHNDVTQFNSSYPAQIRNALESRLATARETTDTVAALGIPMKRTSAPPAYSVPTTRKPSPRSLPKVPTQPFRPEPFLPLEEYEYILGILKSMALVIERNPQSFVTLDEEGIRTHFLLQLNGHYEGQATGETFNAAGKTDILIRVQDRNVFVAECKFWKGQASFDAAISQLLGYLSWRDSKCAILVFNRTRDSSAVLKKMQQTILARPEYRKALGPDAHGDERYVFVKDSDPGRELYITAMLFDMPTPARGDEA
jgi:hypothetical protein